MQVLALEPRLMLRNWNCGLIEDLLPPPKKKTYLEFD